MVVSSVEFYEVYRVIRRDISDERAIDAVSALRRAETAVVDDTLALEAADLALEHNLAMADAMIYATALRAGATLVTKDDDFEGLPGVIVVREK
jgi:toxin FitB